MSDIAIETERLILRQWHEEDREPFAALNADPAAMEHFPWLLEREKSDGLVDRFMASIDKEGFGFWAVERKEDGAFLGFVGMQFVPCAGPIEGEVEIGWRLATDYWGKGYAREAAEACLDWFENNRDEARITAMTIADNTRSWGLMERLGMRREPSLDFDHPSIPEGDRCRPQIVYVKERPF